MFQTPITIKKALDLIQSQDYVLPAIQREFTWRPPKVCRLFDSLMQGYPIGSFLFWEIDAERSQDFTWYGFVRDYHEQIPSRRHCPTLDIPRRPVVAILDGQQRLTSLNIGLRGSHAEKEHGKWSKKASSYPTKHLYLNLCAFAPEDEMGLKYDFRFLVPAKAEERDATHYWFKVSEVFGFDSGRQVHKFLQGVGLASHDLSYDILYDLYTVVHEKGLISYYRESAQDAEKVLNIFIRVNSAGTPLSYSDMLLSIATARWSELKARESIPTLVDELNGIRQGFQLTKDLVLKAGLMLSDIQSVAFRVTNFNNKNMEMLEGNWADIEKALRLAVGLLADFGFSQQTLTADSVVIPVAYYLFKRRFDENYLTAVAHREDRERIRGWVCRSLVKSGVWGSGLDTLLLAIRAVLQEQPLDDGFPVAEIEAAMSRKGKSLRFTEEEIQDLLDCSYGEKRTFALLALLFPHIDVRNLFHVDHVFPKSLFTRSRQRDAGVPEEKRDDYLDSANRLPNLQLLEGAENNAKRAKLPTVWLAEKYPDEAGRMHYCDLHDLGLVPATLPDFDKFYAARWERLAARLRQLLGVQTRDDDEVSVR